MRNWWSWLKRHGSSVSTGLAIGVALGVAFDNLASGLPIGVALAFVFAAGSERRGRASDHQGQNER